MPSIIDILKAFTVGGAICMINQILIDNTKLTPAKILVSNVVVGVVLTGLGVYGWLVDWAGAGATVPLTGFGYALANGVKQGVEQYGWLGAFSGGLTATAVGLGGAMFFAFIVTLVTKPSGKK